jgi:chorismate dehydratase
MLRYGSVPDLNAKPLLEGLASEVGSLRLEVPSRLVPLLRSGEVDVALAPIVAALEDPDLSVVPAAAIAARGPVESVLLFTNLPPGECATVGLDTSSRTSADLVRVLFRHRWGRTPRYVARDPDPDLSQATTDAVLLIGDPALRARWSGAPPIDLADEWVRWTGLPFVFAAWLAATPEAARQAHGPLVRAAARGATHLERIAADGARDLGLPLDRVRRYLQENLHFGFGPLERAAIERFRALRAAL